MGKIAKWGIGIGMLGAASGTGVFLAAGNIAETNNVPEFLMAPLDELPAERPPATVTVVCASDKPACDETNSLSSYKSANQMYKPLSEISPMIQRVVVASEDDEFFMHDGVDTSRVMASMIKNIMTSSKEGGSTMVMQLFSQKFVPATKEDLADEVNFFDAATTGINGIKRIIDKHFDTNLSVDENDVREFALKAYEAQGALTQEKVYVQEYLQQGMLESEAKLYAKGRIIEEYLNIVYFGRNAIGVEAAAQAFFGTTAKDLDATQSALLIAMLTGPSNRDFAINPENWDTDEGKAKRALHYERLIIGTDKKQGDFSRVLNAMVDSEIISAEEAKSRFLEVKTLFEQGGSPFVDYHYPNLVNTLPARELGAMHYVNYVLEYSAEKLGITVDELKSGAYTIETTLKLDHQSIMYEAVQSTPHIQNPEIGAAMIGVSKNGEIYAYVGSNDHNRIPVDMLAGNRNMGSTNKPYIAATALQRGLVSLDTVFSEDRTTTLPAGPGYNAWEVATGQACDRLDRKVPCELTLAESLEESSNSVPLQLLDLFKVKPAIDTMRALGVDIKEDFPSFALGNGGISPRGQATGYNNMILNQGVPTEITPVKRILRNGAVVWEHAPEPKQRVLDKEVTIDIVKALYAVVDTGTGKQAFKLPDIPYSVVGKTGTADSSTDATLASSMCIDQPYEGLTVVGTIYKPAGNIPMEGVKSYNAAQMVGRYLVPIYTRDGACDLTLR